MERKLKKSRWLNVGLIVLIGSMLTYHFFYTYNPPITQPVIVSPITGNVKLDNGQVAQTKVNTPETSTPEQAGFSEQYINDTIGKVVGIKDRENILAINQVKGNYKDSLQLYKTELDEQKRLTKYYQSKDGKGNIVGTAKTTDDGPLVYKGDISLTSIVKKASSKKEQDSIIFYDPTQRVTINQSKEFKYLVPKTKPSKLKLGISAGAGIVVPVKQVYKPDVSKINFGYFVGPSVSYTF